MQIFPELQNVIATNGLAIIIPPTDKTETFLDALEYVIFTVSQKLGPRSLTVILTGQARHSRQTVLLAQ